MIDYETYKALHRNEAAAEHLPANTEELPEAAMKQEQPPGDTFLLLLPAFVQGYSFHDKEWRA